MRPSATSVCGLELLVYAALSATSVCGLKLLTIVCDLKLLLQLLTIVCGLQLLVHLALG